MFQSRSTLTKSSKPGRFRTHLEGLQDEFEIMAHEIESLKQERDQYKAEVQAHAKELEHVRRQIGCDRCQKKRMGVSQLIASSQPNTTGIGTSLLFSLDSHSKFHDNLQGIVSPRQTGDSAAQLKSRYQERLSPAVEPILLSRLESSAETTIAKFIPFPSSSQLPGTLAVDPNPNADWSITFNSQVGKELDVELAHTLSHETLIRSVNFSRDGKFLAAGCRDGKAYVYDVQTGMLTTNLLAKDDQILAVCFSPCGKYLAAASNDNYIYIWEIKTRYVRNGFKGHTKSIRTLCFSPNGRLLLSASHDDTARLWNMRYGSTMILTAEKPSGYYGAPSAIFLPNGRYITSSSGVDQVLRIWDACSGRLIRKLMVNGAPAYDVAVMPDGSGLLSGGFKPTVMYWDISSLVDTRFRERPRMTNDLDEHDLAVNGQTRPDREFSGHTSHVTSIAITSDGKWIASGSDDRTVRIWDTRTAVMQCTLNHSAPISRIDFSPVGAFLAVGGLDGTLMIWRYRYSSCRGGSETP